MINVYSEGLAKGHQTIPGIERDSGDLPGNTADLLHES